MASRSKTKASTSAKRGSAPSSIIQKHRTEAAAELRARGASCLKDGGGSGCERFAAAAALLDPTDPPEKAKALEQEKSDIETVRDAERDDGQLADPADKPDDRREACVDDGLDDE